MTTRVLAFYIHGTSAPGPELFESTVKYISGFFVPDLMTTSSNLELIPFDKAPAVSRNFTPLLEELTEKEDRFYFQWSGNLGIAAWTKASQYLVSRIDELTEKDEDIHVIFIGHSHGGNVGRQVAEHYAAQQNTRHKFHCITIETPLSLDPPILMPANVHTWQHFFNPNDIVQKIGSLLWQKNPNIPLQLEEVHNALNKQKEEHSSVPEGWKSHLIPNFNFISGHNDAVRTSAAHFITEQVKEILSNNISNKSCGQGIMK